MPRAPEAPRAGRVRLGEAVEDDGQVRGRHAGPGVRHLHVHVGLVLAQRTAMAAARLGELERVGDQVLEHASRCRSTSAWIGDGGSPSSVEADALLLRQHAEGRQQRVQEPVQLHRLVAQRILPGLHLGQVQQVVDERAAAAARCGPSSPGAGAPTAGAAPDPAGSASSDSRISVSGVRSSWLTLSKNSLLSRCLLPLLDERRLQLGVGLRTARGCAPRRDPPAPRCCEHLVVALLQLAQGAHVRLGLRGEQLVLALNLPPPVQPAAQREAAHAQRHHGEERVPPAHVRGQQPARMPGAAPGSGPRAPGGPSR